MFSFRKIFMLIGLLVVFTLTTGHAQSPDAKITKTQIRQEKRIHRGVRSGALTRHETKVLQAEQRKIERDKLKAESDGIITKSEDHKIRAEQKAANRDIIRKKNNLRIQ